MCCYRVVTILLVCRVGSIITGCPTTYFAAKDRPVYPCQISHVVFLSKVAVNEGMLDFSCGPSYSSCSGVVVNWGDMMWSFSFLML